MYVYTHTYIHIYVNFSEPLGISCIYPEQFPWPSVQPNPSLDVPLAWCHIFPPTTPTVPVHPQSSDLAFSLSAESPCSTHPDQNSPVYASPWVLKRWALNLIGMLGRRGQLPTGGWSHLDGSGKRALPWCLPSTQSHLNWKPGAPYLHSL